MKPLRGRNRNNDKPAYTKKARGGEQVEVDEVASKSWLGTTLQNFYVQLALAIVGGTGLLGYVESKTSAISSYIAPEKPDRSGLHRIKFTYSGVVQQGHRLKVVDNGSYYSRFEGCYSFASTFICGFSVKAKGDSSSVTVTNSENFSEIRLGNGEAVDSCCLTFIDSGKTVPISREPSGFEIERRTFSHPAESLFFISVPKEGFGKDHIAGSVSHLASSLLRTEVTTVEERLKLRLASEAFCQLGEMYRDLIELFILLFKGRSGRMQYRLLYRRSPLGRIILSPAEHAANAGHARENLRNRDRAAELQPACAQRQACQTVMNISSDPEEDDPVAGLRDTMAFRFKEVFEPVPSGA